MCCCHGQYCLFHLLELPHSSFLKDSIVKRLRDVTNIELESAALEESLDKIEFSLYLESAVQLFGLYLCYYMHNIIQATPPLPNAFSILMYNQRLLSQPRAPEKLQVRTRKDKLYNDVIQMLDDEGLKYPASVVSSSGRDFVKTLTEVLWYIDGHQETIKKQSFPIPDHFLKFVGYNAPELAKHRKRQHTNLSVDVLNSLSFLLFLNLQASFWAGSPWQCLKKSNI